MIQHNPNHKYILYITDLDEDKVARLSLMRSEGIAVEVTSPNSTPEKLARTPFDLLIVDLHSSPQEEGLLRDSLPKLTQAPIVFLSSKNTHLLADPSKGISILPKEIPTNDFIQKISQIFSDRITRIDALTPKAPVKTITIASYPTSKIIKGTVFIKEGQKHSNLFFIQRGQCQAFKTVGTQEIKLGLIMPGEIIGEMGVLMGQRGQASVRALEDCEAIQIPAEAVTQLMQELPIWFNVLVNNLCSRLVRSNNKLN